MIEVAFLGETVFLAELTSKQCLLNERAGELRKHTDHPPIREVTRTSEHRDRRADVVN